MTVLEAVAFADGVKPNAFTQEQKVRWLSELEGKLEREILHRAAGALEPYPLPGEGDRELLAPFPYDKVYWMWLCAMVDFANGEYDKYANSMAMANDAYEGYATWYRRGHPPEGGAVGFRVL